jgi:phosphoribosylaminoimidazolecarboxamide formyltransferase/IMP cyclohydrolase
MLPVRRALVSVFDKRNLEAFAKGLIDLGIEIVSTGGTLKHLAELGIPVIPVAEVTGFPEILDGRVKTLHPMVHGGILADRSRSGHLAQLAEHGIQPIDLVAVNLYPFRETAAQPGMAAEKIIDMIDVGGPTMVRAAAKNFHGVVVVVDPEDYPQVLGAIEENSGIVPGALRRQLAVKAFRHTQAYDAAIARWLTAQVDGREEGGDLLFPRHLSLDLLRASIPRYGENPHQGAAVYRVLGEGGVLGGFEQLQGKELSYNNLLDADAARKLVASFDRPAVVIVKHNNPCGVGLGDDLPEAYGRALQSDPVSAFGSVIAVNRAVGADLAGALEDLFVEVLVAPEIDGGAQDLLAKKASLRLLACPPYAPGSTEIELRGIAGGLLAQVPDGTPDDEEGWTCPTRRSPTAEERRSLSFAWKVCRYTKSNAIVLSNEHQTVGIGAGQMSRVDSCRLAVEKAVLPVAGSVAASDAFFPFRDGLDLLARAGVTAVIQPGGSRRDEEVVAAADEAGMAMLFTGRRHFRH